MGKCRQQAYSLSLRDSTVHKLLSTMTVCSFQNAAREPPHPAAVTKRQDLIQKSRRRPD